ncbi:TRL-like family protein [Crocinitomix sp.]|nr:TRL-like family protein [Crocinitomix sp.]
MKKIFGIIAITALLGSCTIAHQFTVTNNPVGTKKGVASGTSFSKDLDISSEAACKNGGISKIGTMEFKATSFVFITRYKTVITGE